jgi:hypothetical protein
MLSPTKLLRSFMEHQPRFQPSGIRHCYCPPGSGRVCSGAEPKQYWVSDQEGLRLEAMRNGPHEQWANLGSTFNGFIPERHGDQPSEWMILLYAVLMVT